MQVLVQVNIIIVVVILITEIFARFTTIRRRTVGVGEVVIHGTFVGSKAVRKVQSVGVALVKWIEIRETERSIRSKKTRCPKRRQVKELILSVCWK